MQVISMQPDFIDRLVRNKTRCGYDVALLAMKAGYRVAREGWNGKGMWICLGEGQQCLPENLWNKHTRAWAQKRAQEAYRAEAERLGVSLNSSDINPIKPALVTVLPYFIMKTADDKILMGWLASQTDMVAEDWIILED